MRGTRSTALAAAIAALALAPMEAPAQMPLLTRPFEQPADATRYSNPVAPGDYPDPSVMRNGDDYWAVVTSGGWRPPFTVLHSKDLLNWAVAGSVLRRQPPWTAGHFWAPELVRNGDRFLVYYSAQGRDTARQRRGARVYGGFCIGVASAPSPAGFFRDHGPITCPRYGAIDPVRVHDEGGRPYLLWKEDGNDYGRPTPIKAAPLSGDGLRLVGPPRELLRNDQPWERHVVEGPALARRGDSLYLFYSSGSCCGTRCDYQTGVARSKTLMGPWEKQPGPLLTSNARFRCPGHGSVVESKAGESFLAYHAYARRGAQAVGRQLLIDRIEWPETGWPIINGGHGPSARALSPGGAPQVGGVGAFVDEFSARSAGWQWLTPRPRIRLQPAGAGRLQLGPARKSGPALLGRQPNSSDYTAELLIGWWKRGARPGLAVVSLAESGIGIELRGKRAVLWRRARGRERPLASRPLGRLRAVGFRVVAREGRRFSFQVGTAAGWLPVGAPDQEPPPWGGEMRVAMRVAGQYGALAAFERFAVEPSSLPTTPP